MSKKTVFKEVDNMKKNIIGLVIILIFCFSLGKYFFKSEVRVEYLSENSNPEYQSDLKIIGDKIYFKDFKSIIGSGAFLDDKVYVFLGLDNNEILSKFTLNFDNYSVTKNKVEGKIESDSDVIFYEEDEFIVIGDGIIRYDGEKIDKIAKDISFNGQNLYKISDDGLKIMYYNSEKDSIYTYHVPKKIVKRISYGLSDDILSGFNEDFKLSDDGGYIYISEKGEENSISVIGSDSSKVYGNHIIGENPIWVKNTEKAAYLYPYGELEDKHNYKIGVFNIPKRKIDYINYSDDELLYPYMWSSHDGDIVYFVGEENGDFFNVSSLIRYDMSDSVKTRYDRNYSFEIARDSVLVDKNDGKIAVFYYDKENRYNCDFINTESGSEMNVDNIKAMENYQYIATDNGFIVNADNAISYYDGDSTKVIYRLTGSLETVMVKGDNISIAEKISEGSQMVFFKVK